MSAGATGTKGKRSALKKALVVGFEWNEDSINAYAPAPPRMPKGDDMDSKIARVQARKKDTADRANRLGNHAAVGAEEETAFSRFQVPSNDEAGAAALVDVLNGHYDSVLSSSQGGKLVSVTNAAVPLHLYDDALFDEQLVVPQKLTAGENVWAACLVTGGDNPENSPRSQGFGRFAVALVEGITEASGFTCTLSLSGASVTVEKFHLCFLTNSVEVYAHRVQAALERRKTCVNLMRYSFCVASMPYDDAIVSIPLEEQVNSIVDRAMTFGGTQLPREAADSSVEEAVAGYEQCMKQIIYDANMFNTSNLETFAGLDLPAALFAKVANVPQIGIKAVPKHAGEKLIARYGTEGYLSSAAGIHAMQSAVALSEDLKSVEVFHLRYKSPMALEPMQRFFSEQVMLAVRAIKQEWPSKTGKTIRAALLEDTEGKYNVNVRDGYKYHEEDSDDKSLVTRMTYIMGETLTGLVRKSLKGFTETVTQLCDFEVSVADIRSIVTTLPETSIYLKNVLPPLLSIGLRPTDDKVMLNRPIVEENLAEIAAFWKTPEGLEPGAKCPIQKVAEIWGFTFEYTRPLSDYKNGVLEVFDSLIRELGDVPHLQKVVMEKIFFPAPKFVPSASADEPLLIAERDIIATCMDRVLDPLVQYLGLYKNYERVINTDNAEHIASKIQLHFRDPESSEIELPVTLSVVEMKGVVNEHLHEIEETKEALPTKPLHCGLFVVDLNSIRDLLLEKHNSIIRDILTAQTGYCKDTGLYLEEEYRKILKVLSKRPTNIEELTTMEEFIDGHKTTLTTLEQGIADMMGYFGVLDAYKFRTEFDVTSVKWTVYGMPSKVAQKIQEVRDSNTVLKAKQEEEMNAEQVAFTESLVKLEADVVALETLDDVADVTRIHQVIKDTEKALADAQVKVRLYNSRESLFGAELTDYEDLNRVVKLFEPFLGLWSVAYEWTTLYNQWITGPFVDLDSEKIEALVEKFGLTITKTSKYFVKQGMDKQASITSQLRQQIEDFKPEVPLIVCLRNPGMRDRHWDSISKDCNVVLTPIEDFTTEQILAMNLKSSMPLIEKICESAAKEYQIETALNKMEAEWADMYMNVKAYRETGTGVLAGIDDINLVLDEQITMTQTIMFSAFKGPFEERIDAWNAKLCNVSDVLEVWMAVQRNWLYLQPIFDSVDINRQLPAEGKKFSLVDKNWRSSISAAKNNAKVIDFCDNEKLLERFRESEIMLDQVQKGLSDYLETKRGVFARLYFLSNDELLSILSESKDVKRVQPHLKKCFEGIDKVHFAADLKIEAFISPENEEVKCQEIIDPVDKNVEAWMLELEGMMRVTIRQVMKDSIDDYLVTPRPQWMQKWPGMCVLNGSQMHWTTEMETLFEERGTGGPPEMLSRQIAQLADMTVLVRGKLSNAGRTTVGALTVIDVHARDVIMKLVEENVETKHHFGWTSQLRYYWEGGDSGNLWTQMVAAKRPYGYEYLGNSFRLVITPLTDKCYLTLMGALQMIFGGAPAGPAGTGKTETTKDLAKALAMQCVVFNCSDGLDYKAMGKFFKGLAACGAWACFDEFNRINIEVLSVIGQQIMSLQNAIKRGEPRIIFEGSDIAMSPNFAVFITMNPGYAGRSALPDSLQALFRPVAMMVPDYALIGEIMFFAYGFELAKECGAKMVTTFKLCSEQLSAQPHYDYGMRAVKTVITAAGNLKRAEPDADEYVLLLRALQDVNIPKFLEMDLPLFAGIISDLFPGKKRPVLDYGALMKTMKEKIASNNLQPKDFFIAKVIQLYEMIVVRHGLMLVGPTGGGKSSNLKVLQQTLSSLKQQGLEGFAYENVQVFKLNPKAITMGQMYGEVDSNTMEWMDGIMSTIYRNATVDTPDRKWIMFDGPVDAIWIENMNTVLDDNKKLCLNSGEIIKMSGEMTMMFEVEDLTVASPATVSRVGIIYMEPRGLGLDVLLQSWLKTIPPIIPQLVHSKLTYFFDLYMESSILFMRNNTKELCPTVDNNLAQSLMRILDCYFAPFVEKDGEAPPTDVMIADIVTCIEPLFYFALIWSIGGTVDERGRAVFDQYIRAEAFSNKSAFPFPKTGEVYDYLFIIDSKKWTKWMEVVEKHDIDPKTQFAEIIVPTTDSVRNMFMMDLLLSNDKHVLMVGNTGTGKTINAGQYLSGASMVCGKTISPGAVPLTITFSANSSANQTQDMLDSKMDKRRKGVYGPPAGKKFYVYVDDLNMPKKETYGAQPPIEILRQWFGQDGWYDRKELTYKKLIDLVFLSTMGPPGGGRQDVTPRFLRNFNIVGLVEMSENSKVNIFGSILRAFLTNFEGGLVTMTDSVVMGSLHIFDKICAELLPTPSKSHYTFNLRDLAKIFGGVLMCSTKTINSKEGLARLWVHEVRRVFADRFTNTDDHAWLRDVLHHQVEEELGMIWDEIIPHDRMVYGDFMNSEIDCNQRVYDEIEDLGKLKSVVEEYLVDHNSESKQPMPLVMFSDAIEHVARIARILRQPQGNALLLGVGGSGRQSMSRLATYISGFVLVGVEIVKGYTLTDWRDDLKRILMQAGVKDTPTTFLFSDVQIIDERMVEDLNNILNSGDVPNLYASEDMEAISAACRIECQKKKIPATKLNIFSQYILRVKRNMHLVVCMSPLGEAFRNRLRNFPALVNNTTIDWFTNWPAEALLSVGKSIIETANLGLGDTLEQSVVMFKTIHTTVEDSSVTYYEMMRRRNWVTPTSYLELLSSFGKLIKSKRVEIATKRDRLQIGLDKLSQTGELVSVMQKELEVLAPQLVVTQKEVAEMMVIITADKASAAITKDAVEVEEAKANVMAAASKAIADDAEADLAEAIPALKEAVKCLDALQKADIDEVKSLKTPPGGVVLTIKVCCLMFGVKPIKKNDPDTPGKKIEDYWDAGKNNLLSDAKAFILSLKDYDKDNIPDKVIKAITPFIEAADDSFTPKAIEKASKACTAVCMWARAMHKYHFVALGVAPKRAKLEAANAELKVVMEKLAIAQATLKEVNDKLEGLEVAFNAAVEKKDGLETKEAQCKLQLSNADKLIGGLGGEKVRWTESVVLMNNLYENVLGDIIVSAGTISYLGPFTMEFRIELVGKWRDALKKEGILHTAGCDLEATIADPVKVRTWQICNLPSDSLSTQNAIIMDNGRRWPLLIDPQGQANKYIRTMAKDKSMAPNGMDVVKLSDKNFLRTLENGVQFGRWVLLENIYEQLDAALEPILLQQTFKQGGQEMMKLGDNVIPYNDSFSFFMTTKLANPDYAPEVQVKVSLLNFTITMGGLEEQLLNVVVAEEMPDLAEQKAHLVVENAANNKRLFDIESEILFLLSNSKGNILDDTVLIDTLAQSKVTSEEIKEMMAQGEEISNEIAVQSEHYRPVAKRSSLLYFVTADLGHVDPMYQYSLQWFSALFTRGIASASPSAEITTRVSNINDFFTFSVYNNICRSLFERHKLLFSFIMCIKVLQGDDLVDNAEYRFLLSGITTTQVEGVALPESDWLELNIWSDLMYMASLPAFTEFPTAFEPEILAWQEIFDSPEPHRCAFPAPFAEVSPMQRLCVLRCLRRDKIELAMQDFISSYMEPKFIEPPAFDLKGCFDDSAPIMPLIFILSSGSDPNKDLETLAEAMGMSDRLHRIALGQGQGKKASNMIEKGVTEGNWVMLQNCHLSISWMPTLEMICEAFEPDKMNPEFRLWLTSMPSTSFPTSVLQNGIKITKEPPKGLRANLKSTYMKLDNEKLQRTNKVKEYQKLLFGLAFYHALVVERKKFGPLGWNIGYEFNDTDKDITAAQLELYVNEYDEIPYKVLCQLTSVVNYGGRITDDKDMRTSDIIIADFFKEDILRDDYAFSKSGKYFSMAADADAPHSSYMEYIESFPLDAEPEVFGMHDNANITCAITSADDTYSIILTLQPRIAGGTGASREDQIIAMAADMHAQLPLPFDVAQVGLVYATDYHESMNTVLVQECERYNKLLVNMHVTLVALQKALQGLVVLSAELDAMGTAMFNQVVPANFTKVAYPSLKPCTAWYKDLLRRLEFTQNWIDGGVPANYWISGFFFPQGFLTACLQNFARKWQMPIDTVAFSFIYKTETEAQLTVKPDDGVYIYGLFLEGARWDVENTTLIDPKPKELFALMPVIHMLPVQYRETPQSGIYRCPVYKVLTRTGVLSTTGHSTNFVTWIEVPSNKPVIFRSSLVSETNAQVKFCDNDYWIKGGVAAFCSLRY